MIRLPTIGLSSPPFEPGGRVSSVKTFSESPEKPSQSSALRISTSQPSPKAVEISDNPIAMTLRRRRPTYSGEAMGSPNPALDPQQHVTRHREHYESDNKEDEAERNERRCIEIADRLGELIGDGGRDRGAGRDDRA